MSQQSLKGGRKLRRSPKKKSYYTAGFQRTAAHKARRAAVRSRRKAYWHSPEGRARMAA